MKSDASDATVAAAANANAGSRRAEGGAANAAAGDSEGGVETGGGAERGTARARDNRLRVDAMQSLLAEIFRVAPDEAVVAATAAAAAEVTHRRDSGDGAPEASEAAAAGGPRGQAEVEALMELIRAGEGLQEDGGPGGGDADDSEDDEEDDDDEGEDEEEEEEEEDEEQGRDGGADGADEGHVEELDLAEATERLVEITNIPHQYARVLLASHDGDLEAAIATVMDVF